MNFKSDIALDQRILQVLSYQWRATEAGSDLDIGLPILERAIALAARSQDLPAEFIAIAYLNLSEAGLQADPRHETILKRLQAVDLSPDKLQRVLQTGSTVARDSRTGPQLDSVSLAKMIARDDDLETAVDVGILEQLERMPTDIALPPMVDGKWVSLGSQDELLMRAVATLDGVSVLENVYGTRQLVTDFYPGVTFIEIHGRSDQGQLACITCAVSEDFCFALDGASVMIHWLNETLPINLTDDNVSTYLSFFLAAVHAEHGPFRMIDSLDDLRLTEALDEDVQTALATQISSGSIKGDSKSGWTGKRTLQYSNALFHAEMRVRPGGMVEMMDDEPIAADLPIKTEEFIGHGIRCYAVETGLKMSGDAS